MKTPEQYVDEYVKANYLVFGGDRNALVTFVREVFCDGVTAGVEAAAEVARTRADNSMLIGVDPHGPAFDLAQRERNVALQIEARIRRIKTVTPAHTTRSGDR